LRAQRAKYEATSPAAYFLRASHRGFTAYTADFFLARHLLKFVGGACVKQPVLLLKQQALGKSRIFIRRLSRAAFVSGRIQF
jgi:hypothetical protein